ncbi:MAG: thioesterase family protein [Planctomycetota bacterium]
MTEFSVRRTVRLADTDAAGVVYFARALDWCHAAYEEWLESVDLALGRLLPTADLVLPVVHAEITHSAPLVLGDELVLELTRAHVGRSSYTLAYLGRRGEARALEATITHVCIDRATRQSQELPADFRRALAQLAASGA